MALLRAQTDVGRNPSGVINARKTIVPEELPVERKFYDEERNVEYLRRGANDNQRAIQNVQKIKSERSIPANQNKKSLRSLMKLPAIKKSPASSIAKTARVAVASMTVITGTVWVYICQIPCAALAFVSFGGLGLIEESWWGTLLDKVSFGSLVGGGLGLFFIGTFACAACGLISFLQAVGTYSLEGINVFRGTSILIMAICFALYFFPVFNFFPLMWLWVLYIFLSSRKSG